MQGSLSQIQLPEVLQFVSMGKSSGLLAIRDKAGNTTTLTVRQGRIVNSNALERSRKLGDLLVYRGIIRRSMLNSILGYQRHSDPGTKLGQLLIERELATEKQIEEVLRLQLEEEIWALFGLEQGDFRFEPKPENQLPPETVSLEIEPLILEGTRRQDEWRKISRILPTDRIIPAIRQKPAEGETFPRLRDNEWKVLSAINGVLTIRGIVNRTALGRFEVFQILAFLLRKGVVVVKGEAPLIKIDQSLIQGGSSPAISTKSVGGLLARLTGSLGRDDRHADRIQFQSPISMLAAVCNRLADAITGPRNEAKPKDLEVIIGLWADALSAFPRADLIKINIGRIDVSYCEKFFANFEFGEAVQDAYEDSIEALVSTIELYHSYLAAKVSEKSASKLVREAVDEYVPRATLQVHSEFRVEERLQGILVAAS